MILLDGRLIPPTTHPSVSVTRFFVASTAETGRSEYPAHAANSATRAVYVFCPTVLLGYRHLDGSPRGR
jgi:hypothetical protein